MISGQSNPVRHIRLEFGRPQLSRISPILLVIGRECFLQYLKRFIRVSEPNRGQVQVFQSQRGLAVPETQNSTLDPVLTQAIKHPAGYLPFEVARLYTVLTSSMKPCTRVLELPDFVVEVAMRARSKLIELHSTCYAPPQLLQGIDQNLAIWKVAVLSERYSIMNVLKNFVQGGLRRVHLLKGLNNFGVHGSAVSVSSLLDAVSHPEGQPHNELFLIFCERDSHTLTIVAPCH